MKKWILFAVLMSLATSSQAVKLQQDTQSLSLSGNWDFQASSQQIDVGYGYFIMDYFEVGGLVEYAHNENLTAFGFGPKAEYNFELDIPVVVPFVGSSIMFKHGKVSSVQLATITTGTDAAGNPITAQQAVSEDETKNALALSLYGGAKFFLSETVAISAALVVDAATTDLYAKKDGDTSKTDTRIELGIRSYF